MDGECYKGHPSQEVPVPGQSRGMPWSSPPERRGPAAQVGELKTLVIAYARQETLDPLRTLGRSMGFGIAGSVALGTGFVLLLLALLRGLQQITFFNDPGEVNGGTWSWLPYLIVAIAGLVLVALFMWRLMAFARNRQSETETVGGPIQRGSR